MKVEAIVPMVGANLIGVAAFTSQSQEVVAAGPDMTATMQVQIILLVTTVTGFIYNLIRDHMKSKAEERKAETELRRQELQRQWDIEDRRMAREEMDAKFSTLDTRAAEVKREVRASAQTNTLQNQELGAKIDRNTEITQDAAEKTLAAAEARIAQLRELFETGTRDRDGT
jgi:hypothetical protein